MLARLVPDLYVSSVQDVPLDQLRRQGMRGLLVDLDNTLVPWHDTRPLPADICRWFAEVETAGLRAAVISNSLAPRVEKTMSGVEIPYVSGAGKPAQRAFRRGLALLDLPPDQVAMVGDQLFTDVLGARRTGMYTVLVEPLSQRELLITRMRRPLERWLIRRFRAQGLISY